MLLLILFIVSVAKITNAANINGRSISVPSAMSFVSVNVEWLSITSVSARTQSFQMRNEEKSRVNVPNVEKKNKKYISIQLKKIVNKTMDIDAKYNQQTMLIKT